MSVLSNTISISYTPGHPGPALKEKALGKGWAIGRKMSSALATVECGRAQPCIQIWKFMHLDKKNSSLFKQSNMYRAKGGPSKLLLSLLFFLYASAAQTIQPILTHNGSNDAVCSKEVPFGGGNDVKLFLGVENPPKPKFFHPRCRKPS